MYGASATRQSRAISTPEHRRPPLGCRQPAWGWVGRRRVLLIRPFVANGRGGTATPKVTYMGPRGRRGLEKNAAGNSGSPGMGSSGASRGDAGTACGRRRLKVRKDARAAPGTGGKERRSSRHDRQVPPGAAMPTIGVPQSAKTPAADAGVRVSAVGAVSAIRVCFGTPCLSVFQRHLDSALYDMF